MDGARAKRPREPGAPGPARAAPAARRHWTSASDDALRRAVADAGAGPHLPWTKIAAAVGDGRDKRQCRERWLEQLDPAVCRLPWTAEEDAALAALPPGAGWAAAAAAVPRRTVAQVKRRWWSVLRPGAAGRRVRQRAAPGSPAAGRRSPHQAGQRAPAAAAAAAPAAAARADLDEDGFIGLDVVYDF